MLNFTDYYGNSVKLSFQDHPFSSSPKHVWVICHYNGKWLLTEHKRRGIEFPGGKVEDKEDASDAAVREVHEETGATVKKLHYVGQYVVEGKGGTIVKNIYFAEIKHLETQPTYFETKGPVLMEILPKHIESHPEFSFMMKDGVLTHSLVQINKLFFGGK